MLENLERRELLTSVNVTASDAHASEQPQTGGLWDPGQFRISRSDSTGYATVNFEISGLASYGMDYAEPRAWYYDSYSNTLRGTVNLWDGQSSANINIQPINDAFREDTEDIVLKIVGASGGSCCCGGSSYGIGASSSAR